MNNCFRTAGISSSIWCHGFRASIPYSSACYWALNIMRFFFPQVCFGIYSGSQLDGAYDLDPWAELVNSSNSVSTVPWSSSLGLVSTLLKPQQPGCAKQCATPQCWSQRTEALGGVFGVILLAASARQVSHQHWQKLPCQLHSEARGAMTSVATSGKPFLVFLIWHGVVKAFEIMLLDSQQWLQDFQLDEVFFFLVLCEYLSKSSQHNPSW